MDDEATQATDGRAAPDREGAGDRAPRRLRAAALFVGPLTAATLAAILSFPYGTPFEAAALVGLTLLVGDLLVTDREPGWSSLLPFMGGLTRAAAILVGAALLAVLDLAGALPGLTLTQVLLIGMLAVIASLAGDAAVRRWTSARPPLRVAVIGSRRSADSLGRELGLAHGHRYVISGRIPASGEVKDDGEVPTLGALSDLGDIVARHRIDLLLMDGEAPRMRVFEEVARSCLSLPVRLRELSGFYEETFGHVPVGEINAAWFQWIMHPKYRAKSSPAERALDLVVASLAILAMLPPMVLIMLIIRRDGGPALFRQVRVGEGGRPFTIYKLRTMREGASSQWATADDDRVTPIGRILRKTHLDEMPQVVNVLRGEMSIVGPRPEQPDFVARLEQVVPYYQRRHLMKPGITGWAQVRCGYAGSDVGSAWKVCHDLYYLKHRSLGLNLVILGETVRTLVADAQYTVEPANVDFILAPARNVIEPKAARVPAAS